MKILRLVLGDQLSQNLSALRDLKRGQDVILMVEVQEEATYVHHHPQKIALVLAAMRHFAEELRADGVVVDYVRLDAVGNRGSFRGELERAIQRHRPDRIVVIEPGEWRVLEMMRAWEKELAIPVEVRADDRFLCSRADFAAWAADRKSLRMEHFYRYMRRKTGWLMTGGQPEGGRWNFDAANRKRLPAGLVVPPALRFAPDPATREVIELVGRRFGGHFGSLESFGWAVRRQDALAALQHFVDFGLSSFGDYQDAMQSGQDFLFHSALSPYLNIGLLEAREVCLAALDAYQRGDAPLAAVEGFIRQILGWREFVRGIYWQKMPAYAGSNYFAAARRLPAFYWGGDTEMNCVRQTVSATWRNAYAHHIQRLMVPGNFALLAGIAPVEVEEWYLAVYADAFEWVELPNTHGMALYADGGLLASKPYAASGAYIQRMSDYCASCAYDPQVKVGQGACPFNFLYWNFIISNQAVLESNPRMALAYRSLARLPAERRRQIVEQAAAFLAGLEA